MAAASQHMHVCSLTLLHSVFSWWDASRSNGPGIPPEHGPDVCRNCEHRDENQAWDEGHDARLHKGVQDHQEPKETELDREQD